MSSYSYVMADISYHPEKYNIVDENCKIMTLRYNNVIDDILRDDIKKMFVNYEIKHNEKDAPIKHGNKLEKTDVNVRYYFDDFASFKSVAIIESICDGTELDLHGLLNDVFEKIVNYEIFNEEDEKNYFKFSYDEKTDRHVAKCKIAFGNPIIIDQYGTFDDEFNHKRRFKLTCALPYVVNPRPSIWEIFAEESRRAFTTEDTSSNDTITSVYERQLNGTLSETVVNTATATAVAASHTHTTVDIDADVNVLHGTINTNHASTSSNIYGTSNRNLALREHREQPDIAEDASDVRASFGNGFDLDSSAAMQNLGSTTNTNTASATSVRELVLGNSTYSAERNHDHVYTLTADARTTINGTNSYTEALERYNNREFPTLNEMHNEIISAYERALQQQRPRVERLNHLVDISI